MSLMKLLFLTNLNFFLWWYQWKLYSGMFPYSTTGRNKSHDSKTYLLTLQLWKYIKKYLPSFSIGNAEKFDLYANKNSKYSFYKLNNQIEALEGEKRIIQHNAKMKDFISLKKIEERDRQLLVEKIILSIEFSNPYKNPIDKTPQIIETVESNYKISRQVYQALFIDILLTFYWIHSCLRSRRDSGTWRWL